LKPKEKGAWWDMLIVPVLGRMRQENVEFKASLGYKERPVSKIGGGREMTAKTSQ
jgi:hypothetical protein